MKKENNSTIPEKIGRIGEIAIYMAAGVPYFDEKEVLDFIGTERTVGRFSWTEVQPFTLKTKGKRKPEVMEMLSLAGFLKVIARADNEKADRLLWSVCTFLEDGFDKLKDYTK